MWKWLRISILVLCGLFAIAAGLVHWRSYHVSSVGHWYGEESWLGFNCSRGKVVIGIGRQRIDSIIKHDFYERPVKARSHEAEFDESFHGGKWLGIGYYQSEIPAAGFVLVPIWMIWGLPALPVVVGSWRRLKQTRRKSGNLCLNCGYDLRGSSGRCPECGREAVGQAPPDQRPVRSVMV